MTIAYSGSPAPADAFPLGGGELGALIRRFNWASTDLGPIGRWPSSLRTAVNIVLQSPVPMVLLWGADGIMIYNDAYSLFAGDRHPQILGSRVLEGWAEVADFNRHVLDVGLRGGTLAFKNQHLVLNRRNAPEDVWLDLSYSPVLDEGGRPGGVLAIVTEVTQQVLADRRRIEIEQSLLDREAELARVQQIGRIGGLEVDLQGGFRNRRSPEYLLIHGLPPTAARETHEDWVNRIHPDDRERVEKQFVEAVAGTARDYTAEYRIVRPSDGETRWIAVDAIIERDADGKGLRLVGAHTDVTARKQAELALQKMNETLESAVAERTRELRIAEESLRQSQKMEAIGQLTGGIAHDFNNLLTGIIGSLDILRRRIASGRTGDVDRFIEAAMNSANRAASLTQRLLAFSRQQSLDLKPCDLNALIGSLEDLMRRTLGENIELVVDLAGKAWMAEGDVGQIENALLNLVINARDAMPDGGRLQIKTANVSVNEGHDLRREGLEDGDYVVMSVTDNGIGMPKKVIDRVFDPFFTTKPIGQGTGLGLSMVYGYAKQSRGLVRIDSEPGRGTAVKFYMRRHRGRVEVEEAQLATGAVEGNGEVVLVVEDDPAVRQLVVEVLRDAGFDTLEAVDGKSALPVLESAQRIDLLISDVGLPGLNGRQVAEIARRHRPDLQVLFITGYAQHAAVRSDFLGPGMDMITKPFSMDLLAVKIQEMIRRD